MSYLIWFKLPGHAPHLRHGMGSRYWSGIHLLSPVSPTLLPGEWGKVTHASLRVKGWIKLPGWVEVTSK
jgi:hypothetical protein